MTIERIEGVKPVKKKMTDGSTKTYFYHRATGTRLPDNSTSPAFALALARANQEAADAKPPAGDAEMLADLIRQYQASEDWRKLAQSTKDVEVYHIKAIEGVFGAMTRGRPRKAIAEPEAAPKPRGREKVAETA